MRIPPADAERRFFLSYLSCYERRQGIRPYVEKRLETVCSRRLFCNPCIDRYALGAGSQRVFDEVYNYKDSIFELQNHRILGGKLGNS